MKEIEKVSNCVLFCLLLFLFFLPSFVGSHLMRKLSRSIDLESVINSWPPAGTSFLFSFSFSS